MAFNDLVAQFEAAVNQSIADSAIFHQIINGGVNQTVVTGGGVVPTIAKAINDAYNAIVAAGSAGRAAAYTTAVGLEAQPTVRLPLLTTLTGTLNGAYSVVQLVAGNQTTGGGYYRPNDYNASTNAVVWLTLY